MALIFEWDKAKAESNLAKHGIGFAEGSTVFGDPLSVTVFDERHSIDEDRFLTIGLSERFRILVIAHTDPDHEQVRIISARTATPAERRDYESSGR